MKSVNVFTYISGILSGMAVVGGFKVLPDLGLLAIPAAFILIAVAIFEND